MKILPPRTSPPQERIERRHQPAGRAGRYGYQSFRPCLRWEFGFTCAFCLLHESDLSEYGVEGLGLMSIEHFIPASTVEGLINDYYNCFYVCRLCNMARAKAPVTDPRGRRLLNPCRDLWRDHFVVAEDDRLTAREGDSDAEYTVGVYALDDERKAEARRSRRERLEEWMALLARGPSLVETLLERAETTRSSSLKWELVLAAEDCQRRFLRALQDIRRYAAIPRDANRGCACGRTNSCSLPAGLEAQMVEIGLPED